jgi:hypothetical protein
MSSENFDETKIDKTNLGIVWDRVAQVVKLITGDVNVREDGSLQEQIKGLSAGGIGAADGVDYNKESSTLSLTSGGKVIDSTKITTGGYIVFPEFTFDTTTGHLFATGGAGVEFSVNSSGHLESEVL